MYRLAILALYASLILRGADPKAAAESFEIRIRPILANNCFACHAKNAMGGLAVDSREALLKGGKSGPAIVPGNPDESLLIQAVRHSSERLAMPFKQPKLSDEAIADLTAWIKAGAPWGERSAKPQVSVISAAQRAFWAFQPITKPAIPAVKNASWIRSPIDQFVLAKLEQKKLAPNGSAAKRDLIRRAYLDLTGLPPSADEVDSFVENASPGAFAAVVDRLLDSPHYGERWGRYWLDVARYSDDRFDTEKPDPYPNAFRYRDWVIRAFNDDMPYDLFVKAQIAGDLIQHPTDKDLAVGLGFYALSPEHQDDRVDVTTRGFLGLTGACAQCHDHKFDPIPTKDYYALLGVFKNTQLGELPLSPEPVVAEYKKQAKKIQELEDRITEFLYAQATQLAEILAAESPRYLLAARRVLGPSEQDVAQAAVQDHLDRETLQRWVRYLKITPRDNPYLNGWQDDSFDVIRFRNEALTVLKERKAVDEENLVRKGAAKGKKGEFEAVSLKTERYFLWRDLFFNDFYGNQFKQEEDGILYYGPNRGYLKTDGTVERFLQGEWKAHLDSMRTELKALKGALPPQYPFAHVIKDSASPKNLRIQIGGQAEKLGEEAPRAFLSVLCDGQPAPFKEGSGRRELAEAIASPKNPLTARVMVNRIWQGHFGQGIVRTSSNFGQMGERPSHPELLDYLASRFIENGWSMKALHREIMLSSTYQSSADYSERSFRADPDNRLLWRANRRRLDVESLRDSLLFVSGELDYAAGGPPQDLSDHGNRRRTVYGFVSRTKLDGMLSLFDFPSPHVTGEQRPATATALQQLFFLNGDFIDARARALVARVENGADRSARIRSLYRTVFARQPSAQELKFGLEFVSQGTDTWARYAKALLSSNEVLFVN